MNSRKVLVAARAAYGRIARAPILLTLVVILFYAPVVLLGRVFYLKDAQLVVYPTRLLLRQRLLAFDLPQWLPQLDMGMPFLANPSNGVLYPLNLLLLLPAPWCVGAFIVSHAVIAVVGAWCLLRALRVTAAASAIGAIAFALGGYMVSLTWVANYMMSLAWLPWVALMAWRAMRSRRISDAALTGLVWSIQILCGEPQGVVLTGWFIVALVLGFPCRIKQKWRQLMLLGISACIAICVALPQILPALELIPRSRRAAGIQLSEASHWSLHPLRLLELLVPNLFGNPIHFDEFLGFFMDNEDSLMNRDPWIASPYLGSAVVMFAVIGIVAARRRHRYWVRALGILLILSILLAIGRHSPIFALYFQYLPAARYFRYPAKIFGLAAAILPLIAAAGLDAWRSKPSSRLPGILVLILGTALLSGWTLAPIAARALHQLRPDITSNAALHTLRHALSLELCTIVLVGILLVLARRRPRRIYAALLFGVMAVQVIYANRDAYATVLPEVYSEPELARRVRSQTPNGEPVRMIHDVAALDIPAIASAEGLVQAKAISNSLMKDLGINFGIDYADSYLSSEEGPKFDFWRNIGPWRRQMLDVFGVRFWVLPPRLPIGSGSELRVLDDTGPIGATVYENPNALPFAYGVSTLISVNSQAEAQRALRDPRVARGALAVVDDLYSELPADKSPERIGACHLSAPLGNRIDLECDLLKDGYVIVNASHHPNFKGHLDNALAPILRANAFVMAMHVPKGRHRLNLVYSEESLGLACAASLSCCMLCILLVFRANRMKLRSELGPIHR